MPYREHNARNGTGCQANPCNLWVIALMRSLPDLRLDGHTGFFPRVPSTEQRAGFGPAGLSQEERRTGARDFVNSSTVDDERRSLRESERSRILNWLVRMNAN
jgi:hypothetical protein